MSLTGLNPSMARTLPFSLFQSNRPLPQFACHLAARADLITSTASTQTNIWQVPRNPVMVRHLSAEESAAQEQLVQQDVTRFESKLEQLSLTKHVGVSEMEDAQFHLDVAKSNLSTAAWRCSTTVRYCVLHESTRHNALVSLVMDNTVSLFDPRTVYLVEECPPTSLSVDVIHSVTYLTAPERCKPMNCSDVVRAIRRFAIARSREVHAESPEYVRTSIGLKNAFFEGLVDDRTKHLITQTCDVLSACTVIMYTNDAVSGSAVDELLAWAEHMCPTVEKGLHPVHKCKATCSFYCSLEGVRINLFQIRDLQSVGSATSEILGILRTLERRLLAGDLIRPVRTATVPEPHADTVRAVSKIIARVYVALQHKLGTDFQFDKMAAYLGMHLTLVQAAEVVGSVAHFILKPLVYAWTLRREDSGEACLFSCYDSLGLEESLDCVACNARIRNSALEARQRRVSIQSRTLQSARQALYSIMQHFTELEPDFVTWDGVQHRWKVLAKRAIASFKTAHTDMELKCGRLYGVLGVVDEVRLKFCEERCNDFEKYLPKPEAPPINPPVSEKSVDSNVYNASNEPATSTRGRRRADAARPTKKKSRKRKQSKSGTLPAPISKRRSHEFDEGLSTRSDPDSAGEFVPAEPNRSATTPNRSITAPSDSGRSSAVAVPSGNDMMRIATAGLVISLGNRDPLKAAVWNTETGAEPDERERCKQYNQRQRKLPSCIQHTKYGEISGNVAPYVLDTAKLDEIYEHARRVFLDRSNMVKSTSRWLLPTADCGDGSDTESAFRMPGESMRRTELFGTGSTIFVDALRPRGTDGIVLLGAKPYYTDFTPAVDMKVNSMTGTHVWESIVNAPEDGSCDQGTRFGRSMTLPDAINNLGEMSGCRTGVKPSHVAYVSKGEGDCMLAAIISRLSANDVVGNPRSSVVEMSCWGTKMLASVSPGLKSPLGSKCRCNMHLGCPAQRHHVDLPLVSAGTEAFQPGTCGRDSEIGFFAIVTGEHGATIRIIRGGMNFMNAPISTFNAAVNDAKFSQLYIKPYSVAAMRSDLPHAGDSYLWSLLRLSLEGEEWASEVVQLISGLMANDCGCEAGNSSIACNCDGTCAPLARAIVVQKDLQRGHCYFMNKSASVPLTNAVYTRGADANFGVEEEGGVMESKISKWKESWV